MEVGVAAAPVGDLGEGVSGQDVLGEQRESGAAHLDHLTSLPSAPAHRHHHTKDLGPSDKARSKRVEASCAVELLWEAGLGWDQLVGQPRKPRGLSHVWGWNWRF